MGHQKEVESQNSVWISQGKWNCELWRSRTGWFLYVWFLAASDIWAESLIETRYLLHIYCQQRSLINSTHSFVLVMFFVFFSQWTVRAILLPLAELIALLWGKRMGTDEIDSTAMYCSNELSILLRATETDISIVAVKKKIFEQKQKDTQCQPKCLEKPLIQQHCKKRKRK